MQITGNIVHIFPTQVIKDSFRKRDFVLRFEDGKYNQEIKIQGTQDKCEFLDMVKIGQRATIDIRLTGRSYDKKDGSGKDWFTSVEATRIAVDHVPAEDAPADEGVPF